MNDIKVSVSVITYKHVGYIRKCLDSILMQKVNFKYEIVVGEDCSEDGTREILLEYKEKHPDIFVLLLNEKNMGVSNNSLNVRRHCRGEYTTACEGDDFWVDENKLQKQVDFLDSHPDYSAVATNTVNVDVDGNNPRVCLMNWQVNKTYELKHFLKYGMVIHGNSIMRRNNEPLHDERYIKLRLAEPTMGDIIMRVFMYDNGKIYVLPDITHAHRDGSAVKSSFTAQSKEKTIEITKMYFRIVDNITAYYNGKYNLEALKANRMGSIVFGKFLRRNQMDMHEYWTLWKELPMKLRILSIERCIQKFARQIVQTFGRKLKLYKI